MDKVETVRRIAGATDRAHELIADGLSGHKVIEQLLRDGLDMFEASQALAQARRETAD